MTTAALPLPLRRPDADGVRWSASFAVALALHGLAALLFLAWGVPFAPSAMPPAAIMIDLAPVPTPPAPPASVIEPVQPAPQIVPDEPPPPLPKPVERPVQHKPPPRPATKPMVAPPQTAAVPESAPAAPAPVQSVPEARPNAMPSFEAMLAAYLERYKRYPHAAQTKGEQGEVVLRFTMDRQGHVTAARVERGSGHAALDEEVLALIRRAEPLPALPPEIAGQQLELVVPIRFRLR